MRAGRYVAGALLVLGMLPGVANASKDDTKADLLPTRFLRVAAASSTPGRVAQAATPTPSPSPTATPAPDGESEDPEFVFQDRPKRFPPFIWYEVSPERKSRFFMLGMLWWSGENPSREYHALFPIFYHRKNKQTEGHTYLSPLFYWYTSPRGTAGYIFPVYFERQRGAVMADGTSYDAVRRLGVPPLFWYGRVGDETNSFLFPFYFYTERNGHRVLATPIGGGWGTKDDFQGLVGLYYWRNTHYEDYDVDAHVLFPLFWHVAVGKPGERGRVSTWIGGPAFHRSRIAKKGKKHAYGFAPFFYRRTSPEGGSTTVTPLSIFEKKNERESWLATPIGGFSKGPGKATVVVGPWIDRYDHGERFRAFVPLFFHGSGRHEYGRWAWTVAGPYFSRTRTWTGENGGPDSVETDRALLPLFYYARRDSDVRFFSPGVLFHRRANGEFWGLFGPFYRRWSDHTQSWALFPGLWYHRNTQSDTRGFGLLPFYYWKNERKNALAVGLFPIFFHSSQATVVDGQERRRRFQMLLPLYLYSERPGHLTFVSPLYAQFRSPGERRIMAGWLYWDHKGRDHRKTTLFPIYHYERTGQHRLFYSLVGGFESGPGFRRDLWLLFYRRHDENLKIDDSVLFPLYWNLNRPGDRKFFVLPYFRVKQGDYHTEGFVPFWFHTSYPGASQTIVFPLFLWRHDKIEKTRTLFTPLGGYWKQEDPDAFRILAPLVYLARGPHKRSLVFFPLFWYDYDHGRQTVFVPPFFQRRDKKQNITTLVPLFFYQWREDRTLFVSLPGILHSRDDKESTTAILPLLFFWERDAYHSRGIAGPWLWSKRLDRQDVYRRVLFPLMFWDRKGTEMTFLSPLLIRKESGRRALTFIPGFGWASRWNEKGEVVSRATLVGPLYVRYDTQTPAADVVVFPFFWHTHQPGRSTTALFPIFHVEKRGEAWRFLTPLGGGFKDPVADRTWWWVLNTFHYRYKDEQRTAFLPLVYHKSSDREFLLASPLFFHHEDRVLESKTTIFPLFYRHEDRYRKTWVAFPLAWHDERKDTGVKNGAVLPFAFWHGDRERHWTLMPLLLSYYERRGTDHIGVYGPLVDVKIKDRRTVALIPIFRYHRDKDTASFASLPFIFWMRRGEHTRAFVGLGYWNTETGTAVAPFWMRLQQKREDGTVARHTEISWPLPIYVRYKTPKKEIVVVAPFYRISYPDGTRVHGVAPFWSEELKPRRVVDGKSLPSEHNWSVLGDFLAYDRVGRYRRFTVLWGIHIPMKTLPANKRVSRASLEGGLELPPMFPRKEALATAAR